MLCSLNTNYLLQWRLSLSHSHSSTASLSVFFFSLFTPLFLLVLIEPSCNYILSVISFTSPLVSCQLMEPKIGISQNALHLVIVSNGFSNKCVLLSVWFCSKLVYFFYFLLNYNYINLQWMKEQICVCMSSTAIHLKSFGKLSDSSFHQRHSVNQTACSCSFFACS